MSLQWTLVASFLYVEIGIVLLLVLPVASPSRWQKFFNSRFLKSLSSQAAIYFLVLLSILVLLLLDAIREMVKYSNIESHDHGHGHLDTEMQGQMRMFRAQRNFYISGFALFLSLVIRRLVCLISMQASLAAQSEAAIRQAQSATVTARNLLTEKMEGESAQNNSNEAYDKAASERNKQIKDLQAKVEELENALKKEKKDKEALKSQADSLAKEYDRLNEQHSKLVASEGNKKAD